MIENTNLEAPQVNEKPSVKQMIVDAAQSVVDRGRSAALVAVIVSGSMLGGCASAPPYMNDHPMAQMAAERANAEIEVLGDVSQVTPELRDKFAFVYTDVDYNEQQRRSYRQPNDVQRLPTILVLSTQNLGQEINDNDSRRLDETTTTNRKTTTWDLIFAGDGEKSSGGRFRDVLAHIGGSRNENTRTTERTSDEFSTEETLYRTSWQQIELAMTKSNVQARVSEARVAVTDQDIQGIRDEAESRSLSNTAQIIEQRQNTARQIFEALGENTFKETYDKYFDERGRDKPALEADKDSRIGGAFSDLKQEFKQIRDTLRERDASPVGVGDDARSLLQDLQRGDAGETQNPRTGSAQDALRRFQNAGQDGASVEFEKPEGVVANVNSQEISNQKAVGRA